LFSMTVIIQLTRGARTGGGEGRTKKDRAREASTGQRGARARKDWAKWRTQARKDRARGSLTGALCTKFTLVGKK